MSSQLKNWLIFFVLSFIWGTTLFWQKLALREVGPFATVAFRFLFASILLFGVLKSAGLTLPTTRRAWLELFGLSIVYSVLPVLLGAIAGTRIDSGLGSALGATTPLFVVILMLITREEKMTAAKTIGTLLGFFGMLVIIGLDVFTTVGKNDALGQLIMVGSAFGNALAMLLTHRMLSRMDGRVQAFILVMFADLIMWPITVGVERVTVPTQIEGWLGLLWMGLLASGVANILWFELLKAWGATRAGMISYSIPIIGLLAGALLGEVITPNLALGAALVLVGIALVNGVIKLPTATKIEH